MPEEAFATQINAYIDQETRELVLDATGATQPETGQTYRVRLGNRFGTVTVDQFTVEVTASGVDDVVAIPGGYRVNSIASTPALNAVAIPGGYRVTEV